MRPRRRQLVGAGIGLWRARAVEMTGTRDLIAFLYSFVGLGAVLVGWTGYYPSARITGAPHGGRQEHPNVGPLFASVVLTGWFVFDSRL